MPDYYLNHNQGIESFSDQWYTVLQELGEGGNAVTYLVVQSESELRGNTFALKVFKHTSNEERMERFEEELAFLEDTTHPSILRYQDAGGVS